MTFEQNIITAELAAKAIAPAINLATITNLQICVERLLTPGVLKAVEMEDSEPLKLKDL